MKQKILYLLLCCLPLSAWGAIVSDVRVQQIDQDIVITYNLAQKSNVLLYMSINGGQYNLVKAVDGAVGKNVNVGRNLTITYHPLQEHEKFIEKNVRFKVEAYGLYDSYALRSSPYNKQINTYILGQFGYAFTPQTSWGFVFGQSYRGFGWYVDARTNWNFRHLKGSQNGIAYPIAQERGIVYEGKNIIPFYSERKESSLAVAHLGFTMDFLSFGASKNRFNTFQLYIGAGYGLRRICWETTDGKFVQYAPTSYEGISANAGLMFSIYGLTFRAGINTIQFKYMELEAAAGWMF